MRELDRVPLYSTSWENRPSRALAKRLGLIEFGSPAHHLTFAALRRVGMTATGRGARGDRVVAIEGATDATLARPP